MNENFNREKKIVWIDSVYKDSGTSINYNFDITGAIPTNAKNITVQLLKFILPNNEFVIQTPIIKVFGDLGCSNNQYTRKFGTYLLLGVVNVQAPQYYYDGAVGTNYNMSSYCEENINKQIKYRIGNPSNNINIMLKSNTYADLTSSDASVQNSLICLEFEYDI